MAQTSLPPHRDNSRPKPIVSATRLCGTLCRLQLLAEPSPAQADWTAGARSLQERARGRRSQTRAATNHMLEERWLPWGPLATGVDRQGVLGTMAKTRYSLGTPYIDIDEQRREPLPHRYVHGGFEGDETRFSFYFPPAARYGRRFIQVLEGGLGGNENIAQSPMAMGGTIPFAFECGAYLVESNQGHHGADQSGSGGDRRIHGYIASAESARFSRELAAEMYGTEKAH